MGIRRIWAIGGLLMVVAAVWGWTTFSWQSVPTSVVAWRQVSMNGRSHLSPKEVIASSKDIRLSYQETVILPVLR